MTNLTDTEKHLLLRIVEEVAQAEFDKRTIEKLSLSVPEIIALRCLATKLKRKLYTKIPPKHSCL